MRFLKLETKDPHLNLAVEEYLFRHAEDDVFMLWQNAPTVVIGKNQNAYAEIDMGHMQKKGIALARRITGGGAVYHDLGNLNYTFVSTAKKDRTLDFAFFAQPIIEALASLGVPASLSGRNDLEVNGLKISGSAQYACGGRVLHHGTLLFDADLDALSAVLRVDEEKIKGRAIRSTRARVTNLRPFLPSLADTDEFCHAISDYVVRKYAPEKTEAPHCAEIEALCRRNASKEWLFPARDLLSHYRIVKKKRHPFGTVEISLDMENDLIRDVRIRGDFFGVLPISELEDLLKGRLWENITQAVATVDIEKYIFGMTREAFAAQILSD